MAVPHVNNFYRVWFTWFDPTVLFLTVLGCIFAPATVLETAVPAHISPFQPLQACLMHQAAVLYAFMGIMYAVLLRASPDPKVWRIVQAATLMVDIGLIAAQQGALWQQDRLDPAKWTSGDWGNMGFTLLVAVGRVAFLMGIGGGAQETARKRL